MVKEMMICKKWKECDRPCGGKIPHKKGNNCRRTHNDCPGCLPVREVNEDLLLGASND